jgi:hypothetical protein
MSSPFTEDKHFVLKQRKVVKWSKFAPAGGGRAGSTLRGFAGAG